MRAGAIAVGLLATAAGAARAQAPSGWPEFEQAFSAYVAADSGVGASVLVVRDGRVLDRHDVGFADRAAGVPVDSLTIFHWGSITKTLTAIAILQLRDRGRLTLDDPVVRYLPELRRVHDPYGKIEEITIRMLLAHTAGFMNSTWPYDEGEPWEPFEPTTWEQLVAMMPFQRLHFEPGSRYGYSNPAFIYLARIVEQLTGDPWESYVQKNLFAPLGLSRSYFRTTPYHLAAHRSHHYSVVRDSASGALATIDRGADFDTGITTPNGGWNAPLADLAAYAAFLTGAPPPGASTAPYEAVLARSSLEEMWVPGPPMAQGYQSGAGQWMGLSFFLIGEGEDRVIGHTGSQGGFRAFLFFHPLTKVAVVAAFNTTRDEPGADAAYRGLQAAALELIRR